jgi:DNA-binding SARP family transcriptional activator/tetratricopeptide (TPR) repeat protein
MDEASVPGLGDFVVARRLAMGLSQQELARLARVSIGTLRDLEQGRTQQPRASFLARVATALATDLPSPQLFAREGGPDGLWIQVIGPLRAWRHGQALALGPPQQRLVLGLLAARAGTEVLCRELVEALWGDAPPAAAVNQVQAYVGRLRQILDTGRGQRDPDGVLVSTGNSYRLQVDPAQLDWFAFRARVARARSATSPRAACEHYEEALALRNGEPLADLSRLSDSTPVVVLRRELGQVVGEYANVALAADRTDRALPYMWDWVGREPLNEDAHALLMRVLVAQAQSATALRVYDELRDRLETQLAIRPDARLSELYAQVLRARKTGEETPSAWTGEPGAAGAGPVPRQLPAPVRGFVGRADQLATLSELLAEPDPAGGRTVVISAIDGAAGIGKSALAVHWAHQVVDHFPDGQLYVDLRGFDPTAAPLSTAEAIRGFLDALHVPAERRPAGVRAQVALYRDLLVDRRVLVVLDNARDSAQVRPLLPANPGCMALVTSRRRLTSLATGEGAVPVTVNLLNDVDARQLLSMRLGPTRMAAEVEVIDELLRRCAGLPLALTIAAARGSASPRLPIAALVAQLRDNRQQLDALSTGEPRSDLRSLFHSSYLHVRPTARRLFRLLGPFAGPDISLPAAASLAGIPRPRAQAALVELCDARLLTQREPRRFVLHDLLRTYAAELAEAHETMADREAATDRGFNHYLHSLHAVDRLRYPSSHPIVSAELLPGVSPEKFIDPRRALEWCQGERGVITALLGQAAEADPDRYLSGDCWYLWLYFHLWAHPHDLAEARRVVATASRLVEDGSVDTAHPDGDIRDRHRQLVVRGQARGEDAAKAYCLFGLVRFLNRQGRNELARQFAQRALDWFRETQDRAGAALALDQLGRLHLVLGEPDRAVAAYRRALELCRELGEPMGEASAADGLGLARMRLRGLRGS